MSPLTFLTLVSLIILTKQLLRLRTTRYLTQARHRLNDSSPDHHIHSALQETGLHSPEDSHLLAFAFIKWPCLQGSHPLFPSLTSINFR